MKNKRKGFTLIEVTLVLALTGVLTTASYSMFYAGRESFDFGTKKAYQQLDNRNVRQYLVNEFRDVDYLLDHRDALISSEDKYYSLEIGESEKLLRTEYENDPSNPDNLLEIKTVFPVEISKLGIKRKESDETITISLDGENKVSVMLENFNPEEEWDFTKSFDFFEKDMSGKYRKLYYKYRTTQEVQKGGGGDEGEGETQIPEGEDPLRDKEFFRRKGNRPGATIEFTKIPGGSIIIPPYIIDVNDPVKVISASAFNGANAFYWGGYRLKSVILPDSVTRIEMDAFANQKISSIALSKNLIDIGHRAFYNNELTNVVVPEGVTNIGMAAFSKNKLQSITIPNTVKYIGDRAFAYNPDLVEFRIGKDVSIGIDNTTRNFKKFYNSNGKQAGTYKHDGKKWNFYK